MALLTTSQLTKSYGAKDIFTGITLSVPRNARITIVGANGIGKTTLLRVLIGLEEPSAGNIQGARNLKIGYLPQEAVLDGSHTLWAECLGVFDGLLKLEGELAHLENIMSNSNDPTEILERYGNLQQDFENQGGYHYETQIRQTLSGLGFQAADHHRPLTQLSGGERTRAMLARLLLSNPDLLVLDEPTNHLDIQAVEWLENYLSHWEGAALIVSHDRYFLDKVVDHVWEMNHEGLEQYRGNYSAYLVQRQERWSLRQQNFDAEKEYLEKELDYIKRNIAAQNTLQAKGRLRRLSRRLDAINKGGLQAIQDKKWSEISEETGAKSQMMSVDEVTQLLRAMRNPISRPPSLKLKLKTERRSGDLVLRTKKLEIGYADEKKPLFQVPDLLLKRGECAALIGPNGAGKTTFLKTLLGKIPPFSGDIILGASLDVAYFAQAHEGLNPKNNLIKEIETVAPKMLEAEIRDHLGRFLFSGGDVFKKVETLSGGERGRLALACLSLSNANLLLLDEPTNHLDIPSQEILQEVLGEYPGTILLVSHDRYLIDALATQIWEILPDQTQMNIFAGTYSEYYEIQEIQKTEQRIVRQDRSEDQEKAQVKRSRNKEKQHRIRLEQVEAMIIQLEARLATLSKQLENPPEALELVQKMGKEYVEVQNEINTLEAEWENLQTAG